MNHSDFGEKVKGYGRILYWIISVMVPVILFSFLLFYETDEDKKNKELQKKQKRIERLTELINNQYQLISIYEEGYKLAKEDYLKTRGEIINFDFPPEQKTYLLRLAQQKFEGDIATSDYLISLQRKQLLNFKHEKDSLLNIMLIE